MLFLPRKVDLALRGVLGRVVRFVLAARVRYCRPPPISPAEWPAVRAGPTHVCLPLAKSSVLLSVLS